MRLIDADALKEKFKEHYDLFVSGYKNEQDMSLADKSRVDEILNSMAEVINAPTVFDTDNATNREVIEKVFNTTSTQFCELVRMDNIDSGLCCSLDWWNALYQKGGKERDYDVEFHNHCKMILNAQKVRNE